MDIVAKRDSLIALLEEDRLRLSFKRNNSAPHLDITQFKHDCDFSACVLFFVIYLVLALCVEEKLLQLGFEK